MLKDISKFQLLFMGFFMAAAVFGLVIFSVYKGSNSQKSAIVTVWGMLDKLSFDAYVQKVNGTNGTMRVQYVQKFADTFDRDLVEALAVGKGPDVILVNQDQLLKSLNKIYTIPYTSFPENTFKSSYIQGSELFLSDTGVIAIPFTVDPMVMYWNRDLFTNANISLPPVTWDEFLKDTPLLTQKDAAQNLVQSAVSLGEYRNITHAKDILSLLIMQAGSPITIRSGTNYTSVLGSSFNFAVSPANTALTFYTAFADSLKQTYTWNRSLPESKTLFLSNKLAVYFGFAGEYKELKSKNPNLNFGVALMPQPSVNGSAGQVSMTYGNVYGFAILRSSPVITTAYTDINTLVSKTALTQWTAATNLPSVRRDSLDVNAADASSAVFAASALRTRSWLSPDRNSSEALFRDMIESVTSGRLRHNEAITAADAKLGSLLESVTQ